MAKVKDNILLKGLSGTIGGQLTFRQIGGKTCVSKYQKAPGVPATEKKKAVQTKFGVATAYARGAVKDPKLKAMYQAFVTGGQRAFNIAMTDALRPPVVESIHAESYAGRVGDPIIIRATDDFKVASVVVSIYNQAGDLVEQGNALARENGDEDWVYIASRENPEPAGAKISVVAMDLPGNQAFLSV
ncbi:MAG: hypothetical protein Q8941_24765 [Bacteroidota bacterium]|nr:hypothetical protein [Bacteroidota bacterium]